MEDNISKNKDLLKPKKADILLIAAVLLIAGIAVIFMLMQKNGNKVIVDIDGDINEYSLSDNREIVLNNNDGGYNLLVIDDGNAYIKEADCPNQICVRHKPIYKNGETIICVPNKISVTVVSNIEKETDN